eukprot:1215029-Heterocapsa_arctica.AAC.1
MVNPSRNDKNSGGSSSSSSSSSITCIACCPSPLPRARLGSAPGHRSGVGLALAFCIGSVLATRAG